MQFQQSLHTRRHENGRISTIRFHSLKYLEGNCMRNLSPADERRPQGLRAHIHTFTMRAFSDSSAKKFAQHTPISSISGTKLAQHTPSTTTPGRKLSRHTPVSSISGTKLTQQPLSHRMRETKLALHTPSHRMCGTKLALHTPSHRMCGTKLALHTPSHRMRGTKLALHTPSHRMRGTKLALLAQNGPMWRVLTAHGELSTAVTTNKPRRANFFTLAPTPGRAGEFLLRAQPPLRLGILPLTSRPPSWRRPSSARKINRQPPTSAPTIRR